MNNNIRTEHQFTIHNKHITVYPGLSADRPVVYLNTLSEEAADIHKELYDIDCPDFTLVAISGLEWNHDMSPWAIPPVFKGDTQCTGGGDEYLRLLIDEIVPNAENFIKGSVLWRGIAGYSLAGLFALYSLYHTEIFARAASVSGSLWYPDFKEYVFSHEMKSSIGRIYLSLGDKESKTRNPYLKTVQECTEEINTFYMKKGIDTALKLNPGNHYHDAAKRMAAGIAWIVGR